MRESYAEEGPATSEIRPRRSAPYHRRPTRPTERPRPRCAQRTPKTRGSAIRDCPHLSAAEPEELVATYEYDEVGNRAKVTYDANGTRAVYTYDEQNRLTFLLNERLGGGDPISSYLYEIGPTGNRLAVTEHDGRHVDYTYDDLYRLIEEDVSNDPEGNNFTAAYEYDKVGNRLRKDLNGPSDSIVTVYDYDDNDRLITEQQTQTLAAAPRFDAGTRYARAPPGPTRTGGRILAGFAAVTLSALLVPFALLWPRRHMGRRARRRRMLTATVSLFLLPLMTLGADNLLAQYNEAMLFKAASSSAIALPDPVVTTYTYDYDDNGNTLSRTDAVTTDTFTYDFENRLIACDRNIGTIASACYAYDADGIRSRNCADGNTTHFLTDKNRAYAQVLLETDVSNPPTPFLETIYLYGDDLIRLARPGATPVLRFYHHDGQLSVRQLTDETGTQQDTYTYGAFGESVSQTGTTENCYRYTGAQFDLSNAFYYLRARYYDAHIGRFMVRDSFLGHLGDPTSLHKYSYCAQDPVNHYDPSGHFLRATFRVVVSFIRPISFLTWAFVLGVILVMAFLYWAFNSVIRKTGPLVSSSDLTAAQSRNIDNALDAGRIYWSDNGNFKHRENFRKMYNAIKGNSKFVRVLPPGKVSEAEGGAEFSLNRLDLYLSQTALTINDPYALCILLYSEWAHSADGGNLDEATAERHLIDMRCMLPPHLRTPYINGFSHDGHTPTDCDHNPPHE